MHQVRDRGLKLAFHSSVNEFPSYEFMISVKCIQTIHRTEFFDKMLLLTYKNLFHFQLEHDKKTILISCHSLNSKDITQLVKYHFKKSSSYTVDVYFFF